MKAAVLCADIGTSSIKLSFIDFDGKQTCFVRESFPFEKVTAGTVEAGDWKEAFKQGIVSLKKHCPGTEVKAIVISGNGPTLVPITKNGKSLRPLYWYDKRLYIPPNLASKPSSFFLPRAAWLKHREAVQYDDVKIFLSTQEWLSYQLGAELVTVLPSPLYQSFYWDDEQCRVFGLDNSKFTSFVELGSNIGKVSADAASYFNLPPETPIVAGGPDYIMALIGTGTIRSGVVCDRAGTSEGINVCTDSPVRVPDLRTLPHVKENLWNVSSMIPQSGKLFEWFRDMTGQSDKSYEDMMQEIIGDQGFDCQSEEMDFFSGSINFSAGTFGSAKMGRAIVESIGFMVLDSLHSLNRNGFPVTEMRLSGGQAKSPLWNQLKANITGCTLHVPEIIDAELAGDACLALLHLKEAADLDEVCQKIVKIKESFYSDEICHAHYVEQFASYDNAISKMGMLFS